MDTGPKILLIDDRRENLLALEGLLAHHGVELLEARSGEEALELLLGHDVALALVDVQMPQMSGFELAELMRGSERTRDVPIIFVTAGAHDRARVFEGYDRGAVDFLVKPIEPFVLDAKVAVFLQLWRQRQQLAERVRELETARALLVESAVASRAQLEEIHLTYDSAPVGLCLFDRELRYVRINRRLAELNGVPPAEHIGKLVEEVVPSLAPLARSIAERIFRTGAGVSEVEFTSCTAAEPGIERTWVEQWRPLKDADGDIIGINVVAEDVTERKRTEEALRMSETYARLLASTAGRLLASNEPERIVEELCREVMTTLDCQLFFNFLLDPGSSVLRLNAWAGIPEEEAGKIGTLGLGVGFCGCAARDGRRLVAEDILVSSDPRADLVRSFGVQAYCCHPLQAEGRVLGTLSFGTRTRTSFTAGEVEFMRMIADQVATAMQRMAERRALALAKERLEEADRHRNEFLAVLSHELRNPLAPIKNSLYVLEHAAPGGDQIRRAKDIIHRQVSQLSRLVDDLLDITRITRNKIVLQRRTLELDELVHRAVEDQRSLFERSEVALELQPAAGALHVHGDDARLVQVVSNLLQNAAKFTPAGGTVRVLVERDEPSGCACIRVRDDGVGMEPETVARLFEPFMQADATLDRSKGGLGLGLALVKGLVELHGGEVTASSEGLGKGSELVVRLPLVPGLPDAHEIVAPAPACPGLRVLVCEDNVDAAESLRFALEIDEHRVEVAHDGPEGLAKARVFRPEVVFCDIGLPGMDGYEVARAFRADDVLRDTFLVALTGYALPEDLERAKAAGFDRHLAKPPSLRSIEALLWAMRQRRPAAGPDLAPARERP